MKTYFVKLVGLIVAWVKMFGAYLKADFKKWHTKTYESEQETKFALTEFAKREDLRGLSTYIYFDTCYNLFMFMIIGVFGFAVFSQLPGMILNPKTIIPTINIILGMGVIFTPIIFGFPERTRFALKSFTPLFWNDPEIERCRKHYRFFYITEGSEIVFTNKKPFFLFCVSGRKKTETDWSKVKKNPIMSFMQWFIVSTLYLRILWPYFFNPIQGAFLEYDISAKKAKIKKGDRVLVIGAGSVPHHMRWKNKLGPQGDITALDLDPYVIKKSLLMERFLEWVRGLFGKSRWVSKHICADSDEIPLGDNSFDVVIAVRCYYVNVEEALRVLRPGGKLVISTCGVRYLDREKQQVESTFSGCIVTA